MTTGNCCSLIILGELHMSGSRLPSYGPKPRYNYIADYTNRLGDRIVANYLASTDKTPGGGCFMIAYGRVYEASRQISSFPLPSWDPNNEFCRMWANGLEPLSTWPSVPGAYRGKGSAGAMEYAGRGQLFSTDQVW